MKITRALGLSANCVDHAGKQWVRIAPDGELFRPHRFADGFYRVADPALGRIKHHAAYQISIAVEDIPNYLMRGYLLRMRGERRGQVNLIAAAEIVEVKVPGQERATRG